MKKAIGIAALSLSFVAGALIAGQVRDRHDLEEARKHIIESIREMEHARAANHYDMEGHGAKAEEHLRAAEHELALAVGAAREH